MMTTEEMLRAFGNPVVQLALRKALDASFHDCMHLAEHGVDTAVYQGRSEERASLSEALMACEELLSAKTPAPSSPV